MFDDMFSSPLRGKQALMYVLFGNHSVLATVLLMKKEAPKEKDFFGPRHNKTQGNPAVKSLDDSFT